MPRPYLNDANSGMVAYHMRKAVEEYLLAKETTNWATQVWLWGIH